MSKIAIVGRKDVYLGFKALGLRVVDARTASEAEPAIQELVAQEYVIIFIAESLAAELGSVIERYRKQATPAMVMIPDNRGSLGIARERVRKLVERAVGIDILSRKET
ncbi:V-type ATP synthase subunit F [Candidatus Acetothermia bacterium]|jgi:V/A-type H+-transporting ATPase subunit F|nr:V-type ATP synthase subunit F [Candidatus Acetothermia bacterium]MCI2432334.1 V-type ATP synthase subunit F [Candidatus Acetothermia bacterium]MCI2437323.1 V-type ATP synthase subunit F [Candidatus Acetothermia bacterium]